MNPDEMRHWCELIAGQHRVEHIDPAGMPYLRRYYLSGWNPWTRQRPSPQASLFLHHFVGSDPRDQVHSHPWGYAASLILVGGYREFRCDQADQGRVFLPGDVNVLHPTDKHRIELLQPDCWSLFLAGHWAQVWGFFADCTSSTSLAPPLRRGGR